MSTYVNSSSRHLLLALSTRNTIPNKRRQFKISSLQHFLVFLCLCSSSESFEFSPVLYPRIHFFWNMMMPQWVIEYRRFEERWCIASSKEEKSKNKFYILLGPIGHWNCRLYLTRNVGIQSFIHVGLYPKDRILYSCFHLAIFRALEVL
jgi:hypothetical protein